MKTILCVPILLLLALGCGAGGTEVTNPPIPVSTKLISTSLSGQATRGLKAKLGLSSSCGQKLVQCLTPTRVAGKVYYAGIMVGVESGYSVGPIIGSVTDPSVITSFVPEELHDFDLADQLAVTGGIVCCGGTPYPSDELAIVRSVDIYFSTVDTTFTLATSDGVAEALVGTHIIRTVYGDIDGTELKKGDLLYKGTGDENFFWCTKADGCTFSSRPSDPIQNKDVASYAGSEDGLGNQTIPTFTANLKAGHETLFLTESQVLNNSFAITIDFEMDSGIGFLSDIKKATKIAELAQAFTLSAQPGSQEAGFTSTMEIEMTPNTVLQRAP